MEGYQVLSTVPRISLRLMRKQQQQYGHKFSYITESRKRLHGTLLIYSVTNVRHKMNPYHNIHSKITDPEATGHGRTATQLSPVAESAVSRTLESGVDSWTGLRTHLTTGLDCGRGLLN